MKDGIEYTIWDFCELLELKESRIKVILKGISDYIEPIGSNRDRRYKKKVINKVENFIKLPIRLSVANDNTTTNSL